MISKLPDWHKSILSSRQKQRDAGNQAPLDWEKAKEQIRHKIDHLPPNYSVKLDKT